MLKLSALSKISLAGSLIFSRIIPSINRYKTKIQEIEKNGKKFGMSLQKIWEVH